MSGVKTRVVLPVLVGENSGQVLADVEIKFPTPALTIEKPIKKVEITDCEVIRGKVIIIGQVVKNIPFKTRSSDDCSSGQSKGVGRPVRVICGDIRHCTAFIPFKLFIEIPGACPGDDCEILEACVLGEIDKLIDDDCDGLFDRLVETIDIHVTVRVTRKKLVKVPGVKAPVVTRQIPFSVCRKRRSQCCDP